jgi:hypothetical protein
MSDDPPFLSKYPLVINSSAATTTTLLGLVPGLVMSQLLHKTRPKMQMSR